MEKRDKIFVWLIGITVAIGGFYFQLDYSKIAESGLTLSSIVLAVYIAAIIGLINSKLAKKMQGTVSTSHNDKTQLGVLTTYFKLATFYSVATIIISSIILLNPFPELIISTFVCYVREALSICGLIVYAENLAFLVIIIRFMLNRQIWDT